MSPFSFTLVLLVSAGTGVFDVQMEKDVTFERGGRATPRRDRHKIGGKIVRTIWLAYVLRFCAFEVTASPFIPYQ